MKLCGLLHPETDQTENERTHGDVTRSRVLAWTCGRVYWPTTIQREREKELSLSV